MVTLTCITLDSESSFMKRFESLGDLTKMILVVICEFIFADSVTVFNTEEANTILKL
jgi:hypothetical protein